MWTSNDEMFLHEANQILKTFLFLRPCSPKNSKNGFSHVLILATTTCRCSVSCIPTCSYCIYYCFLPLSLAWPSSLLKVLNIWVADKGAGNVYILVGIPCTHGIKGKSVFWWILAVYTCYIGKTNIRLFKMKYNIYIFCLFRKSLFEQHCYM